MGMQLSSGEVGVKSGDVMEKEPLLLPAIKEKGFDLSQRAAAGIRPTHTVVFLALRHYQVICLFNAVTGDTKPQFFPEGIAGNVGTMFFKVPA